MDHPTLKSFRYCPACGSSRVVKLNFKKIHCEDCQFSLYLNPAAAVSLILYNENDEILIATRAQNPGINLLDLPGGFIDPFETAETAAKREIKEELNIDIEHLEYISTEINIYPYNGVEYQTVDIGFACELKSDVKIVVDPELKKVEWLHYQHIDKNLFAFPSPFLLLKNFINLKYDFTLKG